MPVVTWQAWLKIDKHEQDLGADEGKPRAKLCTRPEMLAAAGLV